MPIRARERPSRPFFSPGPNLAPTQRGACSSLAIAWHGARLPGVWELAPATAWRRLRKLTAHAEAHAREADALRAVEIELKKPR